MNALIPIIKDHPQATPAQIVAIAAEPVYRAIPRYTAVSILAGSLDPLRTFANTLGQSSNPFDQVAAFKTRRLVDGLLGGLAEIAAEDMPLVVQLAPAALQAGVITQDQANALIAAGTARAAIVATEADVQAAKDQMAADAAAEANQTLLQNQLAARVGLVKAQINNGTLTTFEQVKAALGA